MRIMRREQVMKRNKRNQIIVKKKIMRRDRKRVETVKSKHCLPENRFKKEGVEVQYESDNILCTREKER